MTSIFTVPAANARVTNALRDPDVDPAVIDNLRRDRIVAMLAKRARQYIDNEGVYLDDDHADALVAILTGRGEAK